MKNFAKRLDKVETSAIRELFKLLGKPGIISFAGGFPDGAMFDVTGLSKAADGVFKNNPTAALQYGATEGYEPLREQIANLMREKGVKNISPKDLIITTGSQQALDLIGKTLVDDNSCAFVEAPTFLATIQCFRLYGANLIGVPIDSSGVDVEQLEKLLKENKPQFIYLIPTFGNPSGATLTLERRLRVLELAVKYKTLIVEDDPYGDLYFDKAPPPSLLALSEQVDGSRDYLIHCGSLSKVLSPGLRIGWLIAPQDLLSKAVMCKQFSDAHTSTLAQAIAAGYLEQGTMNQTLNKVRGVYGNRAKLMCQELSNSCEIDFTPPQGGLFVWGKLRGKSQGGDANDLAKAAIEKGVAFVPGAPFYCQNPDNSTLRLSFATADEEKIKEGVARLSNALKEI